MIEDLWIVEVLYNRIGSLQDPDSPVRSTLPYHSFFVPVLAKDITTMEQKVHAYFNEQKPDYKIIQMEVHHLI